MTGRRARAVDAGLGPLIRGIRRDVLRVGLHGDLGAFLQADAGGRAETVEKLADSLAPELRRRPAAKIYRSEWLDLGAGKPRLQLSGNPIDVFGHRNDTADSDGEIAVAATTGAEGDVDVEVQQPALLAGDISKSSIAM